MNPVVHERVRVAVRIRPFLDTDPEDAPLTSLKLDETHLAVSSRRVFRVDRVFGMSEDNETIYREMVKPLIASFLEGYSATILAYGQTGSGKTFTMNGLIPDAVAQVVREGGHGRADAFSFQCLEVYGDAIRDLFSANPAASSANVRLYEGPADDLLLASDQTVQLLPHRRRQPRASSPYSHGQLSIGTDAEDANANGAVVKPVQVLGVRRLKANSVSEILRLVESGAAVRATASTNVNAQSSRSHSIFTIFHDTTGAKLHLVDLAGSERNKKTLNVGQRFQESIAINTGLFALGSVIRALARRSSATGSRALGGAETGALGGFPMHVPYRSTKLTRLLQDALGGHSKTLLIACVAPDKANQDETVRTAQYCSLAMRILNEPIPSYGQIRRQQEQVGARSASRRGPRLGDAGSDRGAAHSIRTTHGGQDCEEVDARLHASEEAHDRLLQEVELLRDELESAYAHIDLCEAELSEDAFTFQDQIAATEFLLCENRRLTEMVESLERRSGRGAETEQEARRHAPHRDEMASSDGPWSPSAGPAPATTLSPSPVKESLAQPERVQSEAGAHTYRGGAPRYVSTSEPAHGDRPPRHVPRWSSPSPPSLRSAEGRVHSPSTHLKGVSSATWTGGVVHHEEAAAPEALIELQRDRDEQMVRLAGDALAYQRHNAELRSKLSAMVTLLETHKRESALLRLELDAVTAARAHSRGT